MSRDRLVIHYDRNVNGVATPAEITIKRPHALSLRPKHEARAKDSRAIAEALYKADPTLPFFDGANTDRGVVTVQRVKNSKSENLTGWRSKAEDQYRKDVKNANESEKHISHRKRKKLTRKATREVKTLLHSPSIMPFPGSRTWKDRRDVRKALDTKGSALTIGRAQERHAYKKRNKLSSEGRKIELGKRRAKILVGWPLVMLGSDKKVAKQLIERLKKGHDTTGNYRGMLARLENSILDPFNEIHGVGDALATMMKDLQHGLLSSFATREIEKRFNVLKEFQEFPVLLEKATSPDPKSALAKLVTYSIFYNWATGEHDPNSVIGRVLIKAEDALRMHRENHPDTTGKASIKTEGKKKMHHRVFKKLLPKPTVLEEQMDRKVDRQDMVAMALTYMVLNDRESRANKKGSNNPVYDEFKKNLAAGFILSMNEHPSALHAQLRRGMRTADSFLSNIQEEAEKIIPGAGKDILHMLLGKPQEIKDQAVKSEYETDGHKLLEIYDRGGSKKEFIDATAAMADKYINNDRITKLQKEIWKQAKGYAAVVNDTYTKAQNLLVA